MNKYTVYIFLNYWLKYFFNAIFEICTYTYLARSVAVRSELRARSGSLTVLLHRFG